MRILWLLFSSVVWGTPLKNVDSMSLWKGENPFLAVEWTEKTLRWTPKGKPVFIACPGEKRENRREAFSLYSVVGPFVSYGVRTRVGGHSQTSFVTIDSSKDNETYLKASDLFPELPFSTSAFFFNQPVDGKVELIFPQEKRSRVVSVPAAYREEFASTDPARVLWGKNRPRKWTCD